MRCAGRLWRRQCGFNSKDLIGNGYAGFLSIEPHLSDFKGFAALEKDGISIARKDENKLSGFEAFKLAHDALVKIFSYC
ncbi:MAG: hypothetical protein MJ113_06815 [Lachnospiraceae bacterium]|nr:hypothetical protein [Lachnospiraceae bacterium]